MLYFAREYVLPTVACIVGGLLATVVTCRPPF
jgi:hypothetical protein